MLNELYLSAYNAVSHADVRFLWDVSWRSLIARNLTSYLQNSLKLAIIQSRFIGYTTKFVTSVFILSTCNGEESGGPSRCSGYATGWTILSLNPIGWNLTHLFSPNHSDWLWDLPSLLFDGRRFYFSEIKQPENEN